MSVVGVILAALALATGSSHTASEPLTTRLTPSEDAAIPFACEWGYDWDERCYRDFGDRLPVGGEPDKIWRSALRFPLATLPEGSVVASATLFLAFDGVCLGPRKTQRPCPARMYGLAVHPILSASWHADREVEFGPLATEGAFWAGLQQLLAFDVADVVIEWVEYGAPNNGLLVKLADGEESHDSGGPKFPSGEFANAGLRPVLEVVHYMP